MIKCTWMYTFRKAKANNPGMTSVGPSGVWASFPKYNTPQHLCLVYLPLNQVYVIYLSSGYLSLVDVFHRKRVRAL
jgi:hypothetical protein